MKRVVCLLSILSFLALVPKVSFGDEAKTSLAIVEMGKVKNKKCNYDGYVRVLPSKSSEMIPSPTNEPAKVVYKGDNYNDLRSCYGQTVVFKEMKEKDPITFYFHQLGKVSMEDRYHPKLMFVGFTKQNEDKKDPSFLFKAVKGEQVLDPQPYVDRFNTYIAAFRESVKDGIFISK